MEKFNGMPDFDVALIAMKMAGEDTHDDYDRDIVGIDQEGWNKKVMGNYPDGYARFSNCEDKQFVKFGYLMIPTKICRLFLGEDFEKNIPRF